MGHVAVIDPATRIPELDCFNRMSRTSPVPLTYHLPALYGLDSVVRDEDALAGVVLLGSAASVNDPAPWQTALVEWLLPRVTAGLPTLGLCFGHQLLIRMFGGRVGPLFHNEEKRRGLRTVHLEANSLWGDASTLDVLVSHREGALEMPASLCVLGRSDEVEVEAMGHRTLPVWGFQFHPEATPAFARHNGVPFDGPPQRLAPGHQLVDAFLARI